MSDLKSMAANMVPGGQVGLAALEQAKKIGGEAMKSPLGRKAIATMGKPIFYDINKDFQPKGEKKEKSLFDTAKHFVMRYVLTWGNALGLGGLLANIGIKIAASRNPDTPKPLLGFAGMFSPLLMIGGVAASAWANFFTTTTADEIVGADKRIEAAGLNIVNVVCSPLEKEALDKIVAKSQNTPLRFNGIENTYINERAENPEKGAKIFLHGPGGTGKSEAMDLITGRIITHEATKNIDEANGEKRKEVVVFKVDCKVITDHITGIKGDSDLISGLLSMAGVSSTQGKTPAELVLAVIKGLEAKFKEAKANNQRLVIQLDEINELWNMSRNEKGEYDPVYGEKIAVGLASLIDPKTEYDILMATNLSVENLLGGDAKSLSGTFLEGIYRRMSGASVEVKLPDVETKPRILSVYLSKLSDDQIRLGFSPELANIIIANKSDETKLAEALTPLINKAFELSTTDPRYVSDVGKLNDIYASKLASKKYEKASGFSIEETVKAISSDKSGRKVTIEKLLEDIYSKSYKLTDDEMKEVSNAVELRKSALADSSHKKELLSIEAQEFEKENSRLIDSLLSKDHAALRRALENPLCHGLIQGLIKFNTPKLEELKLKIIEATSLEPTS